MKKDFEMTLNFFKSSYQWLFIALVCSPFLCYANLETEGPKSIGIALAVILAIPIGIGIIIGIICMGIRIIRGILNI